MGGVMYYARNHNEDGSCHLASLPHTLFALSDKEKIPKLIKSNIFSALYIFTNAFKLIVTYSMHSGEGINCFLSKQILLMNYLTFTLNTKHEN